jgi:D-proline reductase (dithiol) PrdB
MPSEHPRMEAHPMPRLDRLPPINRNTLLTFPAQVNDTSPFAHPVRRLSALRLAIVTTAGLHCRGDRAFSPGDQTYRVIPSDAAPTDIMQSHTSIGFDRVPIMRDLNISYPIGRLHELVERGELGGLGPNGYSFMGALRDTLRVESETGPEVARRLIEEGVDTALVTPT